MADSFTTHNSVEICINATELPKSLKSSNETTTQAQESVNIGDSDNQKCRKTDCLLIGAVSFPAVIIFAICVPIFCLAAVVVLPLLFISLIVTRLIQFVRHDEHGFIKAFQVKLIIRKALFIDVLFILLGIGLLALLGIWNELIFMLSVISGLYLLSFLLLKSVHALLIKTRDHVVIEAVSEIIDCVIFLVAVNLIAMDPFDFNYRKLTCVEVLIFYLIGYNLITLFTHLLVSVLSAISRRKNHRFEVISEKLRNKYVVYYANGLKWSIDFVLSILLLLVTWVLFVDRHLIEREDTRSTAPAPAAAGAPAPAAAEAQRVLKDLIRGKGVWGFVAWSLVGLLICAFLWLFKTVLLLAWKAHTVYDRLRDRILENGAELYCLSVLGEKFDVFKQDQDLRSMKKEEVMKILLPNSRKKGSSEPTVDDVKQIVQYFLIARNYLYMEEYISQILLKVSELEKSNGLREKLEEIEKEMETIEVGKKGSFHGATEKITSLFSRCVYCVFSFICLSNFKHLRKSQDDNKEKNSDDDKVDAQKSFVKELLLKSDGDEVRQELVRAHSRCLILANILSSAKEVASCLNNIISVLILVSTFIIWLLLTKLATTQVIVFFASSLLAGTFVFGNTCKTLFQSIVFVFVVHPFDVGDLCVIDDILMEVKNVGIWKTNFSKVGWQEEVIYPNAQLSNKKIINHKTDIDWNDHVEFEVSSLEKDKIIELKQEIEAYLDGDKAKFAAGYNCVEAMKCPTGDNFKIVIDFRHNTNLKNSTYFECVKKKRQLRSEFAFNIQSLLNEKEIKGSKNSGDAPCSSCSNKGSLQSSEEIPEEEECAQEKPKSEEDSDQKTIKDKTNCECKCVQETIETDNGNQDKEAKGVSEITEEEGKQS